MGGMEHKVAMPSCLLGLCLSERALLAVLCTGHQRGGGHGVGEAGRPIDAGWAHSDGIPLCSAVTYVGSGLEVVANWPWLTAVLLLKRAATAAAECCPTSHGAIMALYAKV